MIRYHIMTDEGTELIRTDRRVAENDVTILRELCGKRAVKIVEVDDGTEVRSASTTRAKHNG